MICNLTVKNGEEKLNCTVDVHKNSDESLYYIEPDELKTACVFDTNKNHLVRDNTEMYMEIDFNLEKETNIKLKIKELDKEINFPLTTNKIEKDDKTIKIEYIIDNKKCMYKLKKV